MQRALISLGMIAFVGAVAAASMTGAFFSDTETSTGNTFTAGAIDLTIDSVAHYNGMVCTLVGETYVWVPEEDVTLNDVNQPETTTDQTDWDAFNAENPAQFPQAGVACTGTWPAADLDDENLVGLGQFWNFDDLKPGDSGENTISIHVDSNDAWMCASLASVGGEDPDDTRTEPEVDFGDSDTDSELPGYLNFVAWVDDGDNILNGNETLLGDPISASALEEGASIALAEPGMDPITGDETQYVGVYWCLGTIGTDDGLTCDGESVENDAQTDSFTADLAFYVEQSRNNDDFSCGAPEVQTPQ